MIKKIITVVVGSLLAVQLAGAQVDTGSSTGAQALSEARSSPASPSAPATETVDVVAVSSGKNIKEVVVVEEPEKWWSVNASTGWDSLYMFRGVNILGNGNGLYWLGGDVGITPWANGTFTAGIWYGVGTGVDYQELNVFANYTHSFGALDATFGWIYYYYPTLDHISQNELFWALAYNAEICGVAITPSATYYLNVGPDVNNGGWTEPAASYLLFRVDASIPVYQEIVSLDPWVGYGLNFDFNSRKDGSFFNGGNNFELGLSLPIQITSWFSVSGYVAYSYQWQDLVNTDANTWWAGASASFSF